MLRTIAMVQHDGLPYLLFRFQYDANIKDVLKKTFMGYKYIPDTKAWLAPASRNNSLKIAVFAGEFGFTLTNPVHEFLLHPDKVEDRLHVIANSKEPLEKTPIDALLPYQVIGVEYAYAAKKTFIADEMGLGKTLQAIACTNKANAYPALVVCPASLKYSWEREWNHWSPGHSIAIWDSELQQSAEVIIVNYAMITKLKPQLDSYNFQIIIFDESHYLKTGSSKRTKTAKYLAKKVERVLLLTGTPITSKPKDYISQLQIINRLDYLGGFYNFVVRYCEGKKTYFGWDMGGASNLEELNQKLRGLCYIRRNKKDVLPELPAKRRVVVPYRPNLDKYIQCKNEIEKEYGDYLNERTLKALLESLGEYCGGEDDPDRESARDKIKKFKLGVPIQNIEELKQVVLESKKDFVVSWIRDFMESGEKLVVFGIHREWLRELSKIFKSPLLIGGMTAKEKDDAMESFQKDGSTQAIFINIQAGGTGLTLTAASNVVFTEMAWTPAAHDQAEDRIHRIGQEATSVTAWYLIAENTIEEDIFKLILGKRQVSTEAMEGFKDPTISRILKGGKR